MNNDSRGPAPEEALVIIGGVLLLLGGGAVAAWWFGREEIITVVLTLQHWMMLPAHLVTDTYQGLDRQILTAHLGNADIGPGDLWQLAHDVGRFWRWPACLLLMVLAGLCARQARGRYKRDLDLHGLMREQSTHFRTIKPFLSRQLGPVAPAEGEPRPADPALHAQEWVARFATDPKGKFSEAMAHSALARQLGPLWAGYQTAEPHVRALTAVFALFAARHREEAIALLGDMAEAVPSGQGEGPEGPLQALRLPASMAASADAWMRDPEIAGPAERLTAGHAYTHTALMSLLCYARDRSGVFNPGLFVFVQLIDRPLYMALDSLGAPTSGQPWHRSAAQAAYVEALGAREHWSTERDIGKPVHIPIVSMAANAIRAASADADEVVELSQLPRSAVTNL